MDFGRDGRLVPRSCVAESGMVEGAERVLLGRGGIEMEDDIEVGLERLGLRRKDLLVEYDFCLRLLSRCRLFGWFPPDTMETVDEDKGDKKA